MEAICNDNDGKSDLHLVFGITKMLLGKGTDNASAYVESNPEAFIVWLDAIIGVTTDQHVYHYKVASQQAYSSLVSELWTWFSPMFFHDSLSQAILLEHYTGDSHSNDTHRATSIAIRIRTAMCELVDCETERPRNFLLELAAIVSCRCREYNKKVNFEKLLRLQGQNLQMYRLVIVPLVESRFRDRRAGEGDAEP